MLDASKTSTPVLSVRNLSKAFSGKTVVDDVSFDIYPGETIGLVGENGAGKSTTKNMLCGLLQPTKGEILVNGEVVPHIDGPAHGISAVHQELSLFGSLTVAENISITDLPGKPALVDWAEADRIAQAQLEFLGIEIDTQATIESLGAGRQQVVEIAKALLHADRVLILDEPTTSLTAVEREKLFAIIDKLKARGVAIVFISHFMEEIYRVCDKFIVLRDGKQVGGGYLADVPQRQLEEMMVGRTIEDARIDLGPAGTEEALRIEGLSSIDFNDLDFTVHKGEVLGISGLMGAGRTEIAEAIFGLRPATGTVFVGGQPVIPRTVKAMKARGVCYVPEDRRTNGLFLNRPVRENLSAAAVLNFVRRSLRGFGFRGEKARAREEVKARQISVPSIENRVSDLSGGNQQKVLLGRWLSMLPDILILDEPTKGVDIGAKFDIHATIAELARAGKAVIIVSSDLPELLNTTHRILVMRKGHVVGEFQREDFDSVKIISLAASAGDGGGGNA
jgi:ABC-type sugar transport system ATPase subunit